jgi:uncharacterized protein YbaA (DUF1428 family)
MARYVDGFLVVVPKRKLKAYLAMAKIAGPVWKKHGALEYMECVGDDVGGHMGLPFTRLLKLKKNELAFYSFIVYRSRKQRDAVNEKVMADPVILKMISGKSMPFDMKRMSHGGFQAVVDL